MLQLRRMAGRLSLRDTQRKTRPSRGDCRSTGALAACWIPVLCMLCPCLNLLDVLTCAHTIEQAALTSYRFQLPSIASTKQAPVQTLLALNT